jgi:hypothetical protein
VNHLVHERADSWQPVVIEAPEGAATRVATDAGTKRHCSSLFLTTASGTPVHRDLTAPRSMPARLGVATGVRRPSRSAAFWRDDQVKGPDRVSTTMPINRQGSRSGGGGTMHRGRSAGERDGSAVPLTPSPDASLGPASGATSLITGGRHTKTPWWREICCRPVCARSAGAVKGTGRPGSGQVEDQHQEAASSRAAIGKCHQ